MHKFMHLTRDRHHTERDVFSWVSFFKMHVIALQLRLFTDFFRNYAVTYDRCLKR